jgi:hypothetical protein
MSALLILIHQEGDTGFKTLDLFDKEKRVVEIFIRLDDKQSFSITDNEGIEIRCDDNEELSIAPVSTKRIIVKTLRD